jgi:hypothetical protein
MEELVKVVIYAPVDHADDVRRVLGEKGPEKSATTISVHSVNAGSGDSGQERGVIHSVVNRGRSRVWRRKGSKQSAPERLQGM